MAAGLPPGCRDSLRQTLYHQGLQWVPTVAGPPGTSRGGESLWRSPLSSRLGTAAEEGAGTAAGLRQFHLLTWEALTPPGSRGLGVHLDLFTLCTWGALYVPYAP